MHHRICLLALLIYARHSICIKYLRYLYLLQVSIVCYIYINIPLYWFRIVNVHVNIIFRCIYYDGICLLALLIYARHSICIKYLRYLYLLQSVHHIFKPTKYSQSLHPNNTLCDTRKFGFVYLCFDPLRRYS